MKLTLFALLLIALLAACVPAAPATQPPVATMPALLTPEPPTATPAFVTATPAPAVTEPPAEPTAAWDPVFYLIALEDNGASGPLVGCGDSLVSATFRPETDDPWREAVEFILNQDEAYFGESGLYNALYQSDLQVESLTLVNGAVTLRLAGQMMLGGVCDAPRVQAQLEETLRQNPAVTDVQIFINDVPLNEALSLK
jgi:hypothetical protein